MKTIFSGIQPTGVMHIGNYTGAIKQWVSIQEESSTKSIYCIVDMHAITIFQDSKTLKNSSLETACLLMACGVDPDKSLLFIQSSNSDHAQLSWILSCITRIGWLNRMTQFKDKSKNSKEKSSSGLYIYPNLQAADILLYDTDLVPIGEDQKQHIELTRDIAEKFNNDYNADIFKLPDHYIFGEGARVMSLRDGTKKMSKSDESIYSKITLMDDDDLIYSKVMKAKTDSLPFPSLEEDLSLRPEVANLINIYLSFFDVSRETLFSQYSNNGFGDFKKSLAEILISVISPIRKKQLDLLDNRDYVLSILKRGTERSKDISSKKIKTIKEVVGFF